LPQHFLLSPAARTLSLRDIMRMSDVEAHARFVSVRFDANNGEPLPALRQPEGLHAGGNSATLEVRGLPQKVLRHVGNAISLSEAADQRLPRDRVPVRERR
jgi:hypothetical protein